MTRGDVDQWLNRYIEAWQSYDAGRIGSLFSADAVYVYSPFHPPVRTREAIVASWLDDRDVAGTYEADYHPVAVEGDTAVAEGRTRYLDAPGGQVTREFANVFLMRFNEAGECSEFREFFMERRKR